MKTFHHAHGRFRRRLGAGIAALAAAAAALAGAPAAATAQAASASPRAVPPPSATTAVVNVKVGGDRNSDYTVAPLAGTQLGLYTSQTGGTQVATCTSDADGDCSFVVPQDRLGTAYYVRQISAPPGWYTNPSLGTGGATSQTSTTYVFQTPVLQANNTYSSDSQFMIGTGGTAPRASQGVWQQSRNNPPLPDQCGLKVALIMDLSGSMNGSVGALKNTADSFVDSLQGTPSSMAMFTFSTASPAINGGPNYPGLTSVSTAADAAAFKSRWAGWTEATASGGTNWDRALYEPAIATDHYDVAVVITDGMPTYYSTQANLQGPGNYTRFREMENGIYSANALKALGTRVLAVGVGSGVGSAAAGLNLRAISGPTAYNGNNIDTADYFQQSNFDQAAQALRTLALSHCTPTISVVKQIRYEDGTIATAPAGWTFHASAPGSTATVDNSPQTTTNDGTGAVNFRYTIPDTADTPFDAAIDEEQQAGYSIYQQDGKNAVCEDKITEQPVPVTDTSTGFTVPMSRGSAISCTIINQAPRPVVPATLRVDKSWAITTADGTTTYPDGSQPAALHARLTLGNPGGEGSSEWAFGNPRSGYQADETVPVSEHVTVHDDIDCRLDRVTFDGDDLPTTAPSTSVTLAAGDNVHAFVNHVTCTTTLQLNKHVMGGHAPADAWTLTAHATGDAIPGPTGTSGVRGEVTALGHYQLSEALNRTSPELLAYKQIDNRTDLQSNPLSTGSMSCLAYDRDGHQLIGWADGINGGVTVPFGRHVICTATNEVVPLDLIKVVHGGPGVPSDWKLTATPVEPQVEGLPAESVAGAPAPGKRVWLRPGQTYRITESGGPAGYRQTGLLCHVSLQRPVRDQDVTVNSGHIGTCTLTNTWEHATLSLEKIVVNRYGGTQPATAWTLSASGPTAGVSGPTGDPRVTGATVQPGTYRLAEHGPSGYDASPWSCRGSGGAEVPVTDARVSVAPGADVICTITNHDRRPVPTPTSTPTPPSPGHHPSPRPPAESGTGLAVTGVAGQILRTAGWAALILVLLGAACVGGWKLYRTRREG